MTLGAILLAACCALDQTRPPARDTRPAPGTGAATIRGVVTTGDAPPRPLRRARVTVTGPSVPMGRTVITDDAGAFVVAGLAPGRYAIAAAKGAYVSMNHGARRPHRPGTPVALRPGETREVVVRLPRGGVITGTVTNVDGSPAADVSVIAMTPRSTGVAGERRLALVPDTVPALADDRGQYRIYGLPAGDYVIAAQSPQRLALGRATQVGIVMPDSGRPRAAGLAAVYHPGTTDVARATRVTVAAGEERSGVDLQLQYVPLAAVSGIAPVTAGGGAPSVTLVRAGALGLPEPTRTVRADSEGRFTFSSVPPGRFLVFARSVLPSPTPGVPPGVQWSTAEIAVDGDDVAHVALAMASTVTISGRVVFAGSRPPPPIDGLRLPELGGGLPLGDFRLPLPRIDLGAGGRFVMAGVVPGTYQLAGIASRPLPGIRTAIGPWWLKSIVIDGRDLLDGPLDLRHSTDAAEVTFTDQASELSGTVRDAAGAVAPEVFVVVFGADRGSWFFNSRRIAAVRTDPQGRYTIRNLPPGEYRVAAATDLEQGEWFDPAVLDDLAATAISLTVSGVEQKVFDVSIR